MGHQALDRCLVEEIGGVLERARDSTGARGQRQRQVELGGGATAPHPPALQAGERDRLAGRVLEHEHHLEERGAPHVALRVDLLDQVLEGHVLVRVRAQAGLFHLGDQLGEGGLRGQLGAERERVHEEADEPLGLGARAPGDRRAHDQIVLPAVAVEQDVERRQQRHEQRGAQLVREPSDGLAQLRRQGEATLGAAVSLHGGAGAVRGQIDGARRAGEVLLPVGELPAQVVAGEPGALPRRVVGVLDGELRERGRPARGERPVERAELPAEDTHAPGIGHDVMHRYEQQVIGLAELEEVGADGDLGGEVERPRSLQRDLPSREGVAIRRGEERARGDRERESGVVEHGLGSAASGLEACAQQLLGAYVLG